MAVVWLRGVLTSENRSEGRGHQCRGSRNEKTRVDGRSSITRMKRMNQNKHGKLERTECICGISKPRLLQYWSADYCRQTESR